jgi:hypothetical protein
MHLDSIPLLRLRVPISHYVKGVVCGLRPHGEGVGFQYILRAVSWGCVVSLLTSFLHYTVMPPKTSSFQRVGSEEISSREAELARLKKIKAEA